MQSLLQWGIANSSQDAPPPRPRSDLDPAIIDQILGKPDSQLMKEALAIATDEERDEDERLTALDDFELVGTLSSSYSISLSHSFRHS